MVPEEYPPAGCDTQSRPTVLLALSPNTRVKAAADHFSWCGQKSKEFRHDSLRPAAAPSASETASRAISSSLCAVAILNCRLSNPASWRSHDADILEPREGRKSAGTLRGVPAWRGAT